MTGLIVGLGNILIYVVLLLLVGALIQWALRAIAGVEVPPNVVKLYLVLVALIAVVMTVGLLLGITTAPPLWRLR